MTLAGGVVQGLAIALMHYTAMAATFFVPLGVEVQMSKPIFSQPFLAYAIAGGMLLLSIGNLFDLLLIRREALTHEQVRLVQDLFQKLETSLPLVADVFYRRLFDIAPHLRQQFPGDLAHKEPSSWRCWR